MAVADYVTREDLEETLAVMGARLKAELVGMETRIRNDMATKADVRAEADRMIKAIQRSTSSNY